MTRARHFLLKKSSELDILNMAQNKLRAELRHLVAPQSELLVPSTLPTLSFSIAPCTFTTVYPMQECVKAWPLAERHSAQGPA